MSSSQSPAPFRRPVSVDPSANTPGAPARSYPYEFQVVLLCGSAGGSMFPLTSPEKPKCLLPVANRPILHYQLEMLVQNGFKEVIVVTKSMYTRYLEKAIDSSGLSSSIHIQLLPLDQWSGTADAIRQIADSIFTDFFVISGDLITNTRLHYLADVYRSRDASLVTLLTDSSVKVNYEGANLLSQASAAASKKKPSSGSDQGELDAQFIGLETKDKSNRLVYYKHKADVEETLKIRKSLLNRHVSVQLFTKLRDAHLYLFSYWILDVLKRQRGILSIQNELLPFLVRHQFDPALRNYSVLSNSAKQDLALSMNHSAPIIRPEESYRCYVFISNPNQHYCARANHLQAYKQMNHDLAADPSFEFSAWTPIAKENTVTQLQKMAAIQAASQANNSAASSSASGELKHPNNSPQTHPFSGSHVGTRVQLGQAVVTAEHVRIGDNSGIKRSIIGRQARIGNGVKLVNSIVFENVTIEENCSIQDSIIANNVVIKKGATIKDCKIGPGVQLAGGSEYKNDAIAAEEEEDEEQQ